ncbi:MAG: DUF432 domain-containing protein [Ignisphaera sp.]
MFGKEIETSVIVGMYRVYVDVLGDNVLYRRYRNDVVEKEVITKGVLKLLPMYPVYYPRFITKYILCEFNRPIYVPPMDSLSLYFYLPIDAAVYSYSSSSFVIIDIIPLHNLYKYTLYGPPSRYGDMSGLIARYCKTDVFLEKPREIDLGFCLSHLEVRNKLDRFAILSKLLLDSSPLYIFYKYGSWRCCTQRIIVTINSSSTAVVEYEKEPIESGYRAIDEPEEVKSPLISFRSDMLWGY